MRVREFDDDEGGRLLRIIRRGTGSVVTWRRAQIVLLSAQAMPVAKIAEVTFTSADRVRDVIHNFNTDGFEALYPKYKGGRPRTFTLPERREIKKIAKSKPVEHGLPFSTWSLAKLADFVVAEGVVDDISHEGLRILLREEGVSFQRVKTWKSSREPDYAAKKACVEHLYAIVDGEVMPEDGEPEVVFCMDEFGPLNLQPHPGRQWAERGGRHKDPDREPRPRRRATYTRPHGVRHLFAAYDLAKDQLYGHIKKTRTGRSSSSSAATCAPCTHWTYALRSSATTVRIRMCRRGPEPDPCDNWPQLRRRLVGGRSGHGAPVFAVRRKPTCSQRRPGADS